MRTQLNRWKNAVAASLTSIGLWSTWALAQDQSTTGGTTTTTTSSTEVWYGQWWIWAVGVAVFLIIVIALTNRGGRSNA